MMKRKRILLLSILIVFSISKSSGQQSHSSYIDSLKHVLSSTTSDTIRFITCGRISNAYSEINPDSAFHYAELMLPITQKLNFKLEEAESLSEMGYAQTNLGNYPRSLQYLLTAIEITTNPESEKNLLEAKYPTSEEFTDRTSSPYIQRIAKLSRVYQYAGILYGNSGNYDKALFYYRNALSKAIESKNIKAQCITYLTMGRAYLSMNEPDSALYSLQNAYRTAEEADYKRYLGSIMLNTGRVYLEIGEVNKAADLFKSAINESIKHEYYRGVVASNLELADIFENTNKKDSSLYFIRNALRYADYLNSPDLYLRTYSALAEYYKTLNNSDSVMKYQSLIIQINDNLFNLKQAQQFQNIDFDEIQRKQEIEAAKKAYQNRVTQYSLIAGLGVFLLIAIILYRNNKQKLKVNRVLETTLSNLKSTQAQLIQAEKMASLGQLTAGIAHEIKNPLNFINNFSEVSIDLIKEIQQEREKIQEARDETLIGEILEDIERNLQKVHEHGTRADGIVKSMLQHSRSSGNNIESRPFNPLVREFTNLAYHGMRAGKSPIKVDIELQLDEEVSEVKMISEDFSRVILNLCNNAFDTMREKLQEASESQSDYFPKLSISTKKISDGEIQLTIKDNGKGIPKEFVDKILEPFFTTKKGTEGTGLGLSISYDIIKAHGGKLEVRSKVGIGTEFVIQLPIGK